MEKWQCPRCLERFETAAETSMFWLQRHHIQDHEAKAAYDAVLAARSSCAQVDCSLGKKAGFTAFDKGFLKTLKISSEEDVRGNQL